MHTAPNHLSTPELDRGLADVLASPQDLGLVSAIFVGLREGERRAVTTVELSPEGGIAGDRWVKDHWQKLPDGRPDPRSQVSLMNTRVLRLIARTEAAMCLAGDNL